MFDEYGYYDSGWYGAYGDAEFSTNYSYDGAYGGYGYDYGYYDAGYYGYMWANVIAIDMASVFKKAPNGFLDEGVGRRLRKEIYGVGHTRDVSESVEVFLGRPRSMDPFLEYVGIKK